MGQAGWLIQPAVFPWVALALGLCVGSFLNVVIHRLPKMRKRAGRAERPDLAGPPLPAGEPFNLFVPRSRCPSCGLRIGAMRNIPVLSFIVLRGRCSGCQAKIGLKYPLVELLAGIGAAYSA